MNNNEINEVPFSSFLAGLLLVKSSVSYSELCNISSDFRINYYVCYGDDTKDVNYDRISWLFSDSPGFRLLKKYNDIIKLEDGREITVYEYLYKYTHVFVKSYFNLPDKYDPNYKWEMENYQKKIRS